MQTKADLNEIFKMMIDKDASDTFIKGDSPIRMRIYAEIRVVKEKGYTKKEVAELISNIAGQRDREELEKRKNCEFAICYEDRWRFRVAVFYEKDNFVLVIRKVDLTSLTFDELNLPVKPLERLCKEKRGMILVTGMAGSGKSTTIASMIEYINANFGKHIITVEEPIEFIFKEKKSIIDQRSIGNDVLTYADAIRQSVVHSPDVIYVTTIRDRATCYAALSAAETGVLVVSTVHSVNALSTIERIINFFPNDEHNFVLSQLSELLKGVISLRLLPRSDKEGLIPAYETMTLSPTISALIRENKLWEIPKCIVESDIFDMQSFNQCLWDLIQSKKVTKETALDYSDEKKELILLMNKIKDNTGKGGGA